MGNGFSARVMSSEREWFSGNVQSVSIPMSDGPTVLFAHYTPALFRLSDGAIVLTDASGKRRALLVRGGCCFVDGRTAEIFAPEVVVLSETEPAAIFDSVRRMQA